MVRKRMQTESRYQWLAGGFLPTLKQEATSALSPTAVAQRGLKHTLIHLSRSSMESNAFWVLPKLSCSSKYSLGVAT
jgi:hypothetical protein